MAGLRPDGFCRALTAASEAGCITALDVGPAIGEPVSVSELRPLLPTIDYLLGNVHELLILTGERSQRRAARRLLDAGVSHVVVKQGRDGACLYGQQESLCVPAFPVDTRISVGAGDSFNVGFLYGVDQGRTYEAALRFASAVAAMVVSSDRGVFGAPSTEDVCKFLRAQ